MINCYPLYPGRKIFDLSGAWDFCLIDNVDDPAVLPEKIEYTERLSVPGCFDVLPKYAGKRGTAYYRTMVYTSDNADIMLKFHGLGTWGAVFWDKKFVALADQPYAAMEFTLNAGAGNWHELIVIIDNRFDFVRQPLVRVLYDFYCFGGIYRPVELHELPSKSLDRAQITTTCLDKGEVSVKVFFRGVGDGEKVSLAYHFDNENDCELSLEVKDGCAFFTACPADKSVWSCESPALHTLTLNLGGDVLVERFGLRTVSTAGGKILLNGKPVKLHGFNRHESHPELGPALPLALILEDVQLLQDIGANFVRGSHYPQDQRFLDLCDERGILVWEETIGWGDTLDIQQDEHFVALQKAQQKLMLKASFNHPAVIMWGFLNEAESWSEGSRPLFKAMADYLRQADPSRLVTYATKAGIGDINMDLADVTSFNCYAGWYQGSADEERPRPLEDFEPCLKLFEKFCDDSGWQDKPFLISENGAGGIPGWHDRFRCHWSEEFQADYLENSCNIMLNDPRVAGFSLWVFGDFRSYSTQRAFKRPRAFNNKGVVDEYRRPKLAYDVVKKIFNDYDAKSGK